MEIMDVSELYKYDQTFPAFAKPEEIDAFSINKTRNVVRDKSQLKRFSGRSKLSNSSTRIDFDLNKGYDTFVNKDTNGDEHLDCLLRWILIFKNETEKSGKFRSSEETNLKIVLRNADFVCWRGLLTKIACTPYERRESWTVCVTKYKNVYFMCEFETEEKKQQKLRATDREKLMTYWGYSFERYVTEPVVDSHAAALSSPNSIVVDNSEQYCSVVRSKLGSYRLLFGGEIDCFDEEESKIKKEYLELKTNRYLETDKQRFNFHRFKLIKWWLQSFLIGINRIICGFRDDNGIVLKLEEFNVDQIPGLAKTHWSGSICFNFLHNFLYEVQKHVTDNDPNKVYKFEYRSFKQKITFEEADPIVYGFLRPWFTSVA